MRPDSRMKLLHINRNYLVSALHQAMVDHLSKLGFESKVFCPICSDDKLCVKPNENVCASKCFCKFDRYFFYLKQFKIIRSLKRNIDVRSFDVIHAYTLFTDGNVAMKLANQYNKPFVVAVRDTDVNSFFAKLPYLRNRGIKIMRKAKKVFFLSESYREQVFSKYVPAKYKEELFKKTEIIPNGIDDFWHENRCGIHSKSEKLVKLIFAGQINKRKNVPTIKIAMDILQKRGIESTLTVIGKIVEQEEFNKIKDDPRITYLPAMPKESLIQKYRLHDIFVMPSFTETFGLVYAEAISQGLPVVYSKGQGFDGQFEEGVVGYHCNASNPNDVADAIENVLKNYDAIASRCSTMATKFLWQDICEVYSKIYQGLKNEE